VTPTGPAPARHAVPYAAPGPGCTCPPIEACGGILPDPECPEHGRPAPAMLWHWPNACPPGAA
jgi:hypothetical protein